jgi:O-acetyl-ADP-ribose deacetylase (regulator of RNase III)
LRWYVVINVAAKQLKAMNGGLGGSDMEGRGQRTTQEQKCNQLALLKY